MQGGNELAEMGGISWDFKEEGKTMVDEELKREVQREVKM